MQLLLPAACHLPRLSDLLREESKSRVRLIWLSRALGGRRQLECFRSIGMPGIRSESKTTATTEKRECVGVSNNMVSVLVEPGSNTLH